MSPLALLLLLSPFLAISAEEPPKPDSVAWWEQNGVLLFHDSFDREETGTGAKDIGNGWNSATADRVPAKKQADLDGGILKITNAPEAGHQPHIHHEAGFQDGAALVRFKLPGLSPVEDLTLGFVDRDCKTTDAGHLCYGFVRSKPPSISIADYKTGVMELTNRN